MTSHPKRPRSGSRESSGVMPSKSHAATKVYLLKLVEQWAQWRAEGPKRCGRRMWHEGGLRAKRAADERADREGAGWIPLARAIYSAYCNCTAQKKAAGYTVWRRRSATER
eukprot:2863388-Prymnesium_polylepis.3